MFWVSFDNLCKTAACVGSNGGDDNAEVDQKNTFKKFVAGRKVEKQDKGRKAEWNYFPTKRAKNAAGSFSKSDGATLPNQVKLYSNSPTLACFLFNLLYISYVHKQ